MQFSPPYSAIHLFHLKLDTTQSIYEQQLASYFGVKSTRSENVELFVPELDTSGPFGRCASSFFKYLYVESCLLV